MKRPTKAPTNPITWLLEEPSVRFAWWASITSWVLLFKAAVVGLALGLAGSVRLLAAGLLFLLRRT